MKVPREGGAAGVAVGLDLAAVFIVLGRLPEAARGRLRSGGEGWP